MPELIIDSFHPGMNTLMDQRVIMPYSILTQPGNPPEPAESPYMENVDIVSKAIVSSPGFTLVSSGTGAGTEDLLLYEKDSTTRYLVITQNGHCYSVSPSSFTWNDLGSYGTDTAVVGGTVYKGKSVVRRAIIANDSSANVMKSWDGTTFATVSGTPPIQTPIMESYMGRLFAAKGATLYYTNVEDETDWSGGGTIGFNDIITGLRVQGENLLVFCRRTAFVVQFYYNDSFSLSTPLKKPFQVAVGTRSFKTVTPVYNDIYYFSSNDGFQVFGSQAQFIANNLRTNSLSWKINNLLTDDQYNTSYVDRACGAYFKKKYFASIPYGSDTFNSKTFVYNYDYDSWSTRTGFYPSNYAILPNSNNSDELYFSSQLSPDLYKFTSNYDYNGAGYNRIYKTKRFTMGSTMRSKKWNFLDIRGSIYTNTKLYVDIEVDGTTHTYRIDSSNLEMAPNGSTYGDDVYGNMIYGGAAADSPFKRFGARIMFPYDIDHGRELQITFRNQAAGEPWKVDYLKIDWDYDDQIYIPTAFQTVTQTT